MPGCLAATPIEAPIDVEEGFPVREGVGWEGGPVPGAWRPRQLAETGKGARAGRQAVCRQ